MEDATRGATRTAVDGAVVEHARRRALEALSDLNEPGVAERLTAFYDPDGNYGGTLFLDVQPNERDDVTATDLFAVKMYNVRISPRSARRVLNDGELRRQVLQALAELPDDVELAAADDEVFERMEALYQAVKRATSDGNAWGMTAVLCSRKRPLLFPSADRTVNQAIGLTELRDHRQAWEVFQHLMRDEEIARRLGESAAQARVWAAARGIVIAPDTNRLALLNVALWTAGRLEP